jgi:hypothetical protein
MDMLFLWFPCGIRHTILNRHFYHMKKVLLSNDMTKIKLKTFSSKKILSTARKCFNNKNLVAERYEIPGMVFRDSKTFILANAVALLGKDGWELISFPLNNTK